MINPRELLCFLNEQEIDFFVGVPDSQLKEFCSSLIESLGIGKQHVIAPNEGNAVALAAGYHLATGKIGLVYMQNSGLGNALNPIASLADPKVYEIPIVYMIGWRGMPGIKDEPQHTKQGEITPSLLETLGIEYFFLGKETTINDVKEIFKSKFSRILDEGRSVAFIVKKGAFLKGQQYENIADNKALSRERAINLLLAGMNETDAVVSTTGKISREVYEYRDVNREGHGKDFLTVGSMGHASMIALQISEQKPNKQIWCLDGDGALLMHMGTMALIGARGPKNYIHVLLNNCTHESVGGFPTVADSVDFPGVAKACGYRVAYKVLDEESLVDTIKRVKEEYGPIFIEVVVSSGSRADLGRPKTSPIQNKQEFMNFLKDRG